MVKKTYKYGGTLRPGYFCPKCHLSVEQQRTDELIEADLKASALLDRKAWKRLRQGRPLSTHDTAAFEEAMTDLTARFIGGDIDADELATVAESLRRQQVELASVPVVKLPDVDDLAVAWPSFTLDQKRIVLMLATESLVIGPWQHTKGFDERRVRWTPVP